MTEATECGIGNAECGKKKSRKRYLNSELGMRNAEFGLQNWDSFDWGFGIADFGLGGSNL